MNYTIDKHLRRILLTTILLLICIISAGYLQGSIGTFASASSARSMIVIDLGTNRVLSQHNAYQKMPMASTTKVVTAITALEHGNPDTVVTIPKEACGIEGSSIYLQEGEKLTLKQLLYGLMLQSGNDCAVAIAINVGGSVEKFSDLMNDTAKKLDLNDSNFVNPHGLDEEGHYTTAYDLAVLSAYAMKNPQFREIVGTKRIKIPYGGRDYDRIIVNKNKMLNNYPGATGIKTGFTKKSGRCLVSSAKRGDMELVCVVLNCGPMWETSSAEMDKVFDKFKVFEILKPYSFWGESHVSNRSGKSVGLYSREQFCYPLTEGEESLISTKVELPDNLSAPIAKDTEVGKVKIYYDNQLIFCSKIYTINNVDKMTVLEALIRVIESMH